MLYQIISIHITVIINHKHKLLTLYNIILYWQVKDYCINDEKSNVVVSAEIMGVIYWKVGVACRSHDIVDVIILGWQEII